MVAHRSHAAIKLAKPELDDGVRKVGAYDFKSNTLNQSDFELLEIVSNLNRRSISSVWANYGNGKLNSKAVLVAYRDVRRILDEVLRAREDLSEKQQADIKSVIREVRFKRNEELAHQTKLQQGDVGTVNQAVSDGNNTKIPVSGGTPTVIQSQKEGPTSVGTTTGNALKKFQSVLAKGSSGEAADKKVVTAKVNMFSNISKHEQDENEQFLLAQSLNLQLTKHRKDLVMSLYNMTESEYQGSLVIETEPPQGKDQPTLSENHSPMIKKYKAQKRALEIKPLPKMHGTPKSDAA